MSFQLGFSLAKKPAQTVGSKRKNVEEAEEEEKIDYVTAISGAGLESLNAKKEEVPLIIPMPEPSLVAIPEKYKKYFQSGLNTEKLTREDQNRNEDNPPLSEEDREAMEVLMKEANGEWKEDETKPQEIPLIWQWRNPEIDSIEDEAKRFQADLHSRPDVPTEGDYERVPVDQFGLGLLMGMGGWKPGDPIGKTNAQVVEPTEFLQRPGHRLGLGAKAPEPDLPTKKYIKPGESRQPQERQVLPVGPDGKVRHVKTLDEKLVPVSKLDLHEGARVAVVDGVHSGLCGRILKLDATHAIITLDSNDEQVSISKSDLSLLSPYNQNSSVLQKSKTTEIKENVKQPDSRKERKETHSREKTSNASNNRSWLLPHLVVRIISKTLSDGKYYLKKGTIEDVIDKNFCIIRLHENSQVLEVKEQMIETVIPASGEKVMIVRGKNFGQVGKLLSKEKHPSGEPKAVVQLLEDLAIHTFDLDSVCSYTGN